MGHVRVLNELKKFASDRDARGITIGGLIVLLFACLADMATPGGIVSPLATPTFSPIETPVFAGPPVEDNAADMSFGISYDPGNIFDYIDFRLNDDDPEFEIGRVYWDASDETIAIDINDGEYPVTLQVGQEQHVLVLNNSGEDWENGAVGIANGSQGYRPTAELANATYITTSGAQGMATQAISKNATGVATTFGMVRDTDTSDFSEGTLLYVSTETSGVLTSTPPTSGYNVIMGRVLRSHPTQGIIFVNPRPAPYFGNLAGGDYTDWDYRGQLTAYGGARWWDDIRVDAQSTRVNPATSKPDYGTFVGNTKTFLFDPDADEGVTFSLQVPHSYAHETDVEPHVHWSPTTTNTGTVVWNLECTSAVVSGTFGSTTTVTATQAATGASHYHQYIDFGAWDMSGIDTLSAMFECYLSRNADSAGDTYTGDAAFLEVDFHYLSDTLGSPEEDDK